MSKKPLAGAIAVVVAAIGVTASAAARVQTVQKARSFCVVGVPALSPSKTAVSDTGYCVIKGRRQAASLRYGISQADAQQYSCSTLTGKGRVSKPLAAGIAQATATFQAVSRSGGVSVRSKPRTKSFAIGGTGRVCGKADPANMPGLSQMCDYQFQNPANRSDVCGVVIPEQPRVYAGPFATWDTKPSQNGMVVSAPHFLSPSGDCWQVVQVPLTRGLTWMNQPQFSGYWDCADGSSLTPLVSLFYTPPTPGQECDFGESQLLLGGEFTQFTLPPDSASWGGTLDVVWKLRMAMKNTDYVSHVFADKQIKFTGTANACAELAVHTIG